MIQEPNPLDRTAREVCQAYPELQGGFELLPLGNHGGFSGARLWRVKTFVGEYCLKAWPPKQSTSARAFWELHRLTQLARDCGLTFVPRLILPGKSESWVRLLERNWDLTTWMPGRADFRDQPTLARLRAAVEALCRIHAVWHDYSHESLIIPAVLLRLAKLLAWTGGELDTVSGCLSHQANASLRDLSSRALAGFDQWSLPAIERLDRVRELSLPLQHCICDIWHDHVLFDGNRLTGIVDYGSTRPDHVAADLARLLGSLVGDDGERRAFALDVYSSLRPLLPQERQLVDLLDWTGVVVGAGNWLRWLYLENKVFENSDGVIRRLSELVTRMESWQRPGIIS